MNIPSLLALAAIFFCFFRPTVYTMSGALILCAFGGLTIIPADKIGGLSLGVGFVALGSVALKIFLERGGISQMLYAFLSPRKLGLLTLFTFVGAIGAFLLPRIFAGQIYVLPMAGYFASILQPATANFTQTAYLTISLTIAAAFCVLSQRKRFIEEFCIALVLGALALIITGIVDMVASAAGLSAALSIFKTASYAFSISSEVAGVRRVIGLMTEASAFGSAVTYFGATLLFTRWAYAPHVRARIVLPASLVCFVFAGLSTSSTAYVMLAVTFCLHILDTIWRALGASAAMRTKLFMGACVLVVIAVAATFLIISVDDIRDVLARVVGEMIFKKNQSASYVERSMWTRQALEAMYQTHWIGVGVGSVRTSNTFANIFASTGILGGTIFVIFIAQVFLKGQRYKNVQALNMIHGLKLSLLVSFVGGALAGTTPDYGPFIAIGFGTITGLALVQRAKQVKIPIEHECKAASLKPITGKKRNPPKIFKSQEMRQIRR